MFPNDGTRPMARAMWSTVVIESPFRADEVLGYTEDEARAYLGEAILDCLARRESPYASHQMLTTVLDDSDDRDRHVGIAAGERFHLICDAVAFYIDLGWSKGMIAAKERIERLGLPHSVRSIR